ncbi:MAG TPA: DUF1579 family protein [Chryseolinea sp.]|nr:DUF1579 family protein [Chryseolinea sp.]
MAQEKPFIAPDAKEQLSLLKILEGEWKVTVSSLSYSKNANETVTGKMTARFIYDDMFLETRTNFPNSPFPAATAIIGLDDTNKRFTEIYADDRKVYRVYEMELSESSWTLLRHAPQFHQRFTATIEKNGKQIKAKWEKSTDGKEWEYDFKLLYEKEK